MFFDVDLSFFDVDLTLPPSFHIERTVQTPTLNGSFSTFARTFLSAARNNLKCTADFIFEKKGIFRLYDLNTVYGKSSVGQNLLDSIGQCNRIVLNITREYNTRSLAYAIKRYFEINDNAIEVLVIKGHKRVSVKRAMAISDTFFAMFRKAYER